MSRCERRSEDEQMWRWADVKMRRCERRCEDEKMRYRPPLLEEPCAQTLSGTKTPHKVVGKKHDKQSRQNWSPIVSTGNRAVPAHFPRLGSNLSHLVSKPACLFSPAVSHSCTFTACVVPATLAQISARKTSKTQSNPARRHTSTWTVCSANCTPILAMLTALQRVSGISMSTPRGHSLLGQRASDVPRLRMLRCCALTPWMSKSADWRWVLPTSLSPTWTQAGWYKGCFQMLHS